MRRCPGTSTVHGKRITEQEEAEDKMGFYAVSAKYWLASGALELEWPVDVVPSWYKGVKSSDLCIDQSLIQDVLEEA